MDSIGAQQREPLLRQALPSSGMPLDVGPDRSPLQVVRENQRTLGRLVSDETC